MNAPGALVVGLPKWVNMPFPRRRRAASGQRDSPYCLETRSWDGSDSSEPAPRGPWALRDRQFRTPAHDSWLPAPALVLTTPRDAGDRRQCPGPELTVRTDQCSSTGVGRPNGVPLNAPVTPDSVNPLSSAREDTCLEVRRATRTARCLRRDRRPPHRFACQEPSGLACLDYCFHGTTAHRHSRQGRHGRRNGRRAPYRTRGYRGRIVRRPCPRRGAADRTRSSRRRRSAGRLLTQDRQGLVRPRDRITRRAVRQRLAHPVASRRPKHDETRLRGGFLRYRYGDSKSLAQGVVPSVWLYTAPSDRWGTARNRRHRDVVCTAVVPRGRVE